MLYAKDVTDEYFFLKIVLKRISDDYNNTVTLRQYMMNVLKKAKQLNNGEIDLYKIPPDCVKDVMYISRNCKEFLLNYDPTEELTSDDTKRILEMLR